jgi:hypothetical protein
MRIAFVEYKIIKEKRALYMDYLRRLKQSGDVEIYEGADQPGLFVEIWQIGEAKRGAWREIRQKLGDWNELLGVVEGGEGKIHIWEFDRLESFES